MVKYVFGHASPGHNFPYATLQSNGHYLMLSKGVMTLHCDFSFDWFPFDIHQCEASLDIINDELKVLPFHWNDLKNHWFYKNTFAPIFHPLWDIKVSLTGPYNQTINGERVQRITRTFDLRRKISGYFFHIFVCTKFHAMHSFNYLTIYSLQIICASHDFECDLMLIHDYTVQWSQRFVAKFCGGYENLGRFVLHYCLLHFDLLLFSIVFDQRSSAI